MKRDLSGFTLIELLVTIVIIAILAGIILPAVGRGKELARRVVCSSNLRQIHVGLSIYAQDWDGWFPRAAVDPNSVTYDDLQRNGNWAQLGALYSLNYLDNPAIFYCPSERDPTKKYPYAFNTPITDIEGECINGTYDYWGVITSGAPLQRDSITENPGKALVGDINISWGDTILKTTNRAGMTHIGEGQNVIHIGGDVKWYPRSITKPDGAIYTGYPVYDFSTIDEE